MAVRRDRLGEAVQRRAAHGVHGCAAQEEGLAAGGRVPSAAPVGPARATSGGAQLGGEQGRGAVERAPSEVVPVDQVPGQLPRRVRPHAGSSRCRQRARWSAALTRGTATTPSGPPGSGPGAVTMVGPVRRSSSLRVASTPAASDAPTPSRSTTRRAPVSRASRSQRRPNASISSTERGSSAAGTRQAGGAAPPTIAAPTTASRSAASPATTCSDRPPAAAARIAATAGASDGGGDPGSRSGRQRVPSRASSVVAPHSACSTRSSRLSGAAVNGPAPSSTNRCARSGAVGTSALQ